MVFVRLPSLVAKTGKTLIDRYTEVVILYALHIHRDAAGDLEEIAKSDPVSVGKIVAVLQEFAGDQNLLGALLLHRYGEKRGDDDRFHVSKWERQWNRGRDLWRVKVLELERSGLMYRVVYRYQKNSQEFHVLGVFRRDDFDYDNDNDPRTIRVIAAYNAI